LIAVDTNILIHLWLPTTMTKLAEDVFFIDRHWVAPYFWRSEFRNVTWQYMKRGLAFNDAITAITHAEDLMDGNEVEVLSNDVMELVYQSGCTAYDCEFVLVAKMKAIPLITLDKELLAKFPKIAINPYQFIETFQR
jgi:predicted nucleic acid-binding protein